MESNHRSQQWWSEKWYVAHFRSLLSKATLRDRCRLELQAMSNTTAWMQWVQAPDSRATFEPSEYRILLRWWLGLPLIPGDAGRPCPCCGEALDPYGDHLVSCDKNHPTQRHHAVCKMPLGSSGSPAAGR